ncbi:MAG: class I SAM-dependent methyltransferase [Thermoleophilia bacterium]
MESVNCPVCGGEPGAAVVAAGDRLGVASPDDRFTIVRCRRCGLAYTNPRPTAAEIGAYYPPGYNGDTRRSGSVARLEDAYRRRQQGEVLRWLASRRPQRGRLLDVGCGSGDLLLALSADGWTVGGVEPDAAGAALARGRGLDVVTGRFEDVELPADFAVIVFSGVLEHVADPVAALRRARALLAPGGLLAVLHLPLLDSPQARAFGARWLALDLPRHLTHFENATFAMTAAAAGLRIVGRESYSQRHSAAQLVASAVPRLQKHRFYLAEASSAGSRAGASGDAQTSGDAPADADRRRTTASGMTATAARLTPLAKRGLYLALTSAVRPYSKVEAALGRSAICSFFLEAAE